MSPSGTATARPSGVVFPSCSSKSRAAIGFGVGGALTEVPDGDGPPARVACPDTEVVHAPSVNATTSAATGAQLRVAIGRWYDDAPAVSIQCAGKSGR